VKKQQFIVDLTEGTMFTEPFLVRSKQVNTGRNGQKYMSLVLVDHTGTVDAKVWDNVEYLSGQFEPGDILEVNGEVLMYKGQKQFRVQKLHRVDSGSVHMADFIPSTEVPPETMIEELKDLLREHVTDQHLRKLVGAFFKREDIIKPYMTAPGGKAIHHVSRGGLLEHTLSMARLAVMVADHYGDKINKSVLLTGVLLHDAGKIYELEGVAAYEYTDRGRLTGHLVIGIEMLNELLATIPDFPEAYVLVMKHMIASHHGIPEYGAIRQPQTMEALVLSFIDDLDAKVNSFAGIFATMGDGEIWSGYNRLYERPLFDWRNALPKADRPVSENASDSSAKVVTPGFQRQKPQPPKHTDKPLKGKLDIPTDLLSQVKSDK